MNKGSSPRLVFILLACGGATASLAREPDFERLSSEPGLSQNMVNCVLQDRKGFIWAGAKDGLNRFDGYRQSIRFEQDFGDVPDVDFRDFPEKTSGEANRFCLGREGKI